MSEVFVPTGLLHLEDDRDFASSFGIFTRMKGFPVIAFATSVYELAEFLKDRELMPQILAAVLDNYVIAGTGKDAVRLIKGSWPKLPIISVATDLQLYGDFRIEKRDVTEVLPGVLNGLKLRAQQGK